MLLALLFMWRQAGTTDIAVLMHTPFSSGMQYWLFLAFFASFAVKVPMWPVHTWLPDAHVEAPTAGSVILAGVLLKMGGYGFLRFSVPMLPLAAAHFAPMMFTLGVVAVIYTSLVALAQEDMKKLIAYSSIAHMGVVVIGIFTFNQQGLDGALFQMLSHGIVSAALFLCVGVIYDRIHTREIARYGGLGDRMPAYALVFMLFTMASIGLPGTSGFVGEFLVLVGAFKVNFWLSLLGSLGMILGAAYMLYLYRRDYLRLDHQGRSEIHSRSLAARDGDLRAAGAADAVDGRLSLQLHALLRCNDGRDGHVARAGDAGRPPRHQAGARNAAMNYIAALPEMVLSGSGLAILILGVLQKKDSSALCTMGVLAAFAVTAMLVLQTAPVFAYSGLFVTDAVRHVRQIADPGGGSALACVLALDYNERNGIGRFEFPVLMLFSTVGMMVMASANSLMSLYLGLELQSLAIYVLCAFARDDVRSSEAGLKYFVLSALASGLLLYGISLTYGFSGTMDFGRLSQIVTDPAGVSTGLVVGIAFVIAGLAFKLSAVPFHMWTPDVYEGAPTPVTAFMSTAPKVAPFVVLLRVMIGPFGHVAVQWQPIIYVVSIGSMLLGSFAAIGQTNIKRLMAYSSIGHMGYALIGLAAGTEIGVRGVLIYLLTYVAMSAGAFACIIAMRRGGRQVEQISDLGGLARTDLGLATLLAIFMFSMAGVPPFAGFFGKFYIFLSAVAFRECGSWRCSAC